MKSDEPAIEFTKIIAIVAALAVLLNLALFSLGKSSPLYFWMVITAAALVAYFVIPLMNKKSRRS